MRHSYTLTASVAALMLGILAPNSRAATVITQTFSGSFPATITGILPNQGTVLEESLTLPFTNSLTITTTSYATGGFQTNLFLFNPAGTTVGAESPFGLPDPSTGIIGDERLTATNLPAGMYTLALSDFLLNQSFTAKNLSDGFNDNSGDGVNFVDANGNRRNGNFSLTINPTRPAAVPEPGTAWLAAPFLAVLAIRARKRLAQEVNL